MLRCPVIGLSLVPFMSQVSMSFRICTLLFRVKIYLRDTEAKQFCKKKVILSVQINQFSRDRTSNVMSKTDYGRCSNFLSLAYKSLCLRFQLSVLFLCVCIQIPSKSLWYLHTRTYLIKRRGINYSYNSNNIMRLSCLTT